MIIGDVPVDTGKQLVVALVGREIGIRTSVVTVLVHHMLLHALHVGDSGA